METPKKHIGIYGETEDMELYTKGLKVRQATPEELEKLNYTLGEVRPLRNRIMGLSEDIEMANMVQGSKLKMMCRLVNEGLTMQEIAEKMDLTVSQVSSIANLNGLNQKLKENRVAKDKQTEKDNAIHNTIDKNTDVAEKIEPKTEQKPEPKKAEKPTEEQERKEGKSMSNEQKVKDMVGDLIGMGMKYNLDFVSGMIIQSVLKGDMLTAKSIIEKSCEGIATK